MHMRVMLDGHRQVGAHEHRSLIYSSDCRFFVSGLTRTFLRMTPAQFLILIELLTWQGLDVPTALLQGGLREIGKSFASLEFGVLDDTCSMMCQSQSDRRSKRST